jgi:hypothetical protein
MHIVTRFEDAFMWRVTQCDALGRDRRGDYVSECERAA